MATYSAGTAFLDIIPSFRGVQRAIGKEVRQIEKALGEQAGDDFGKSFEERASKGVDKALGTAKSKSKKAGEDAGAEYGGSFARSLQNSVAKAQRELGAIKMNAEFDDAKARAQFKALQASLKDLQDAKIGVDLDAGAAFIQLEAIRKSVETLRDSSVNIDARTNFGRALAEIAAFQKAINADANLVIEPEFSDRKLGLFEKAVRARLEAALANFPPIDFDADVTPAQDKLMQLRARMIELGDKKIGIDIDAADAQAEIELLRRELATIANDESIDIQVRTDAAGAALELLEIRKLSKLIDDTKVEIKTDVDDNGAMAKLRALRTAMTSTGGSGDESANAFRAFNGVILGVVTLLPALVPVAGAAAGAIALFGAAGIGAAAGLGVLALSFSGIGDAVKALGKQHQDAGKDAEAAAKKMTAANRTVEDAQRSVERATTQASRSNASAAKAVSDAVDGQKDAELDLARAQDDVIRAQEAVTRAREAAQEQIEDLALSLRGGELAERQAVLDLAEAQQAYNDAASQPDLSADDRAQLLLDLDKAALNLDVVRERNGDLTAEQAEWARTGVEGSDQVVSAQRGVVDAQDRVRDAQDRVADSVAAVADAVVAQQQQQQDSAVAIQDAQRNLIQAQEDYQRALFETGEQGSASAQAVATAMGALGPAGREFALYIDSLRGNMRELRDIAQAGVLPGVQSAIDAILNGNGPLFRDFLKDTSQALGDMFRQLGVLFTSPTWQKIFGALADYAPIFTKQFGEIGMNLLTFFGGLFQNLAPYAERFNQGIVDVTASMADWATSLGENSGFKKFMEWLFTEGPKIWEVVLDIFKAVGNIVIAMAPLGEVVLGLIDQVAKFIAGMDPRVLGAIVTAVLGLVGSFQLALGAFSLAMIVLDALLSPLTLWIFLAGAVVTGLVVLYTQSETFRDIVNGVFHAIADVISWWWNTVVFPIFDAIGWWWTRVGDIVSTVWNQVLKPIFDGLGSGTWDGLWTGLDTAKDNIMAGLGNIGTAVWDYLKPGGGLDSGFADAWAGLSGSLTDETNENSAAYKIGHWFAGLKDTVWEYIKPGGGLDQSFAGMWDGMSKALDNTDISEAMGRWTGRVARSFVDDFWEKVKPGGPIDEAVGGWFSSLGNKTWDYFKAGGGFDQQVDAVLGNIWDFLTTPLPFTMEEIGQWFVSLPGRIWDFFKIGGGLDQIGQWIMDGLLNGLQAGWDAVWGWISEQWNAFIKGFKEAFQIDSPSKLFYQFGVWILEGLLNGLASLGQNVLDFFTGIRDWATQKFTEAKDNVGRIVGEWKDNVLGGIRDWAGQQAQNFLDMRDDVVRKFTDMKDTGSSLMRGFEEATGIHFGAMKDTAVRVATDLWGGVQEKFQRMKDNSGGLMAGFEAATGIHFGSMKDNALRIATDLWGGVEEKFTRMKDSVVSLGGRLVSGFMSVFDGIRAAAADPINFVIEFALNRGLFAAWGKIIDVLGLNQGWKLHVDQIDVPRGPKTMLAAGGRVPGWSPNDKADNIPAMLTANEFVQPVASHQYYGTDVMEMMRRRQIPREFFQHLATGGQVFTQLFSAVKKRFPNANLNSGYRPGANDRHGTGEAVDLGEVGFAGGNGRPYLAAMNQALYDSAKPFIYELIYDGAGDTRPDVKAGKDLNYGAATSAAHHNHTHLAVLAQNLAAFLQAFGSGSSVGVDGGGGNGLLGGIWSAVTGPFEDLKNSIVGPLHDLVGKFTPSYATNIPTEMITKLPGAMWDKISGTVQEKWDALKSFGSGLATGFAAATGIGNVDNIKGGSVQSIVQQAAAQRGWGGGAQWAALNWIINHESGWNPNAQNPTSTAYGLFQFLNGTWASTGIAKTSDPARQAVAGMNYIASRYRDPVGAQAFWQSHGWYGEGGAVSPSGEAPTLYDSGGWLPPGITTVLNATNAPEPILTGQQWEAITSRGDAGPTQVGVRVFIGEQELTDMVHVVIDERATDDQRQLRSAQR